jgi:GT2 family glycosyltransferase
MNSRHRIGIVTVTFNSAAVLDDFLHSLLRQTCSDFALYVVDNASSDDTLERLAAARDPRIIVLPNRLNVGVAEGNNIGIRAALRDACSSVLLLNNDTVFGPDLLAKLAAALGEYPADMVVPKIFFFDHPDTIWCAGGYFSALRGASGHYGMGQQDRGQFDAPRLVDYSPTCCMLVKREVFQRIGLMDAAYFAYFDDTDFCLRASRAALRLLYLPAATLRHKVGSLTAPVSNFAVRFHTRNHVYFVLKNYPRWRALLYSAAYYFYLPLKYLLLLRRPASFAAAEKAFREGFSLFASHRRQSAPPPESDAARQPASKQPNSATPNFVNPSESR